MYDVDAFKRGGRKRKIPARIEAELVSWEILNEMRFFGLDKRLEMILSRYGIIVKRKTLQDLYARNKVTFRQPSKVLRVSEAHEARLMRERANFAVRYTEVLMRNDGDNLCYMDETT